MGNFADHVRCTYNNLLPKVSNYGAFILKTEVKNSHIDNSIKVTLKPSFLGNSVLSYEYLLIRFHVYKQYSSDRSFIHWLQNSS